MHKVLSAINYCHKMKIIRSNLKPEIILINKHDKEKDFYDIKICDFSILRKLSKKENCKVTYIM